MAQVACPTVVTASGNDRAVWNCLTMVRLFVFLKESWKPSKLGPNKLSRQEHLVVQCSPLTSRRGRSTTSSMSEEMQEPSTTCRLPRMSSSFAPTFPLIKRFSLWNCCALSGAHARTNITPRPLTRSHATHRTRAATPSLPPGCHRRSFGSVLSGTLAGIMGLTGLSGFGLYLAFSLVLSGLLRLGTG